LSLRSLLERRDIGTGGLTIAMKTTSTTVTNVADHAGAWVRISDIARPLSPPKLDTYTSRLTVSNHTVLKLQLKIITSRNRHRR